MQHPAAPFLQEAGTQQSFLFAEKYITISTTAFAQQHIHIISHKTHTHTLHSLTLWLLKETLFTIVCFAFGELS